MPRKKREPKTKISQKQKAIQAVKQTVRVVVGETKKAKRPYRRRAKPSQPAPPVQQPLISPIPQVIQLPPQQSPFPMFSPEQFAASISSQLNKRREEQPVLAEAMPIDVPIVGMIAKEYEQPSLAQQMNKERPMREEPSISSRPTESPESLRPVIREMEETMQQVAPRQPTLFERVVGERRPVEPEEAQQEPAPKKSGYINKADLAQMYFAMSGIEPPSKIKVDELRKEVNRLKKEQERKR
jgi:hypothetical protein